MMKIYDLKTPAFIVDLDILENNIKRFQQLASANHKKLLPMTKTHKSTVIAKMQMEEGASGFIVGTISEGLSLAKLGAKEITIPYPLISDLESLRQLSDTVHLTLSLDSYEVAHIYQQFFQSVDQVVSFLLIVNVGLNRFGLLPTECSMLLERIQKDCPNLVFKGITTHPGQVYKEYSHEGVKRIAAHTTCVMAEAKELITLSGFECSVVATGSTPTFEADVKDGLYTELRPGNYVFHDAIQIALGVAKEEDCALKVLATVVSNPREGTYIIDCGSKCLGLDKGAHGVSQVAGFGRVVGSPGLIIESLSEEVGVIKAQDTTKLKIGDQIEIIPNHSCSASNMTNYLIGVRNKKAINIIDIDMRTNSRKPVIK